MVILRQGGCEASKTGVMSHEGFLNLTIKVDIGV